MGNINKRISLSAERGVNYDSGSRIAGELADCSNVVGNGAGFGIWKGRVKWFPGGLVSPGPTSYIRYQQWDQGHETVLVFGARKVQVWRADAWIDLTGAHVFNEDPRNPMCLASYLRNRYLIGGTHLRDKNFYWDGKFDHKIVELPTSVPHRTFVEWDGRIWGFGNTELPTCAYYSPQQLADPDLTSPGMIEFRDGPASILLGGHASDRNLMYVWGDKGLWAVQQLGFPLVASPYLINFACDCVSYNSIVRLPDNNFVWMGAETVWGLVGGQVIDLGLSPDGRHSPRVSKLLKGRHPTSLFLCSGFYHPDRQVVVWSWPTQPTYYHHSGSYVAYPEPTSLALDARKVVFWPLKNQGFISAQSFTWNGQRVSVSADLDGTLWRIDYNVLTDKLVNPVPWYAEFDWIGDTATRIKWTKAFLTRRLSGVDRVMMDVWCDFSSTPFKRYFSVKDHYQQQAFEHPTFDPGGPNDHGVPPDPLITCLADLGVTSNRVKVKLHNQDIDDPAKYHSGPEIPLRKLELEFRNTR